LPGPGQPQADRAAHTVAWLHEVEAEVVDAGELLDEVELLVEVAKVVVVAVVVELVAGRDDDEVLDVEVPEVGGCVGRP
jgi:hypothetical protein